MEPKADLPEVGVAGKDIRDAQVLHDDNGGEIDEGNIRLVVVFLPQVPGPAELLRGNVDEHLRACVGPGQQGVDGRLGLRCRTDLVQVVDKLVQDEIRSDVLATLFLEFSMGLFGRAVVLVRVVQKGDPGPGIDEDQECGSL